MLQAWSPANFSRNFTFFPARLSFLLMHNRLRLSSYCLFDLLKLEALDWTLSHSLFHSFSSLNYVFSNSYLEIT